MLNNFKKKQIFDSWINGGFFVFKTDILDFIKSDSTYLEKKNLYKIFQKKNK